MLTQFAIQFPDPGPGVVRLRVLQDRRDFP